MTTLVALSELRAELEAHRLDCQTIGLVPTMGAFHAGHLSLMRRARRECGTVVVSLFVNPTQFVAGEDIDRYPRDVDRDLALAAAERVDILFMPEASRVYPRDFSSHVEVDDLTEGLCGRSRPGHFRGVTTIVAKLFNMVQPHRAYFGKKDYQQLQAIRRMTRDLDFPIEIVAGETVREPDGLAMSSRNAYLALEERAAAPVLHRALVDAHARFVAGERSMPALVAAVRQAIEAEPLAALDYAEGVAARTMQPIERIEELAVIVVAARFGGARLIDNVELIP